MNCKNCNYNLEQFTNFDYLGEDNLKCPKCGEIFTVEYDRIFDGEEEYRIFNGEEEYGCFWIEFP